MKKLIILLLPALMLIGCGEMDSHEATVGSVTDELAAEGYISDDSQDSLENLNDPSLLNETMTVTETSESSMIMKVGGVELLVEFIDQLDIVDDESIAMIVNGIEVTQAIAADPSKLQGLLASIASSVVGDINIMGIDLNQLVTIGLDLINGNLDMSDLSSVFGVLVEGALNMFLASVPFGGLIAAVAGPLLGSLFDGGDDSNDSGDASSGSSGDSNFLGGIGNLFGNIIGSLTGNNSNDSSSNSNNNNSSSSNDDDGNQLFNGIFNLITNLF